MQKYKSAAQFDEDDVDDLPSKSPAKVGYTRVLPVKQHNFYLYKEIGPAEQYVEMIHTIRTADAHDQIYIHLNTPGGHLDTGIAIISAMSECQGTVTTVLDSNASSMGAIIFLAGDQFIVHDFSMLMFHTFSGGFYGKSGDVDKQVQAYKRQYTQLVKRVCSKFLTLDEIGRIDRGEELWFSSDAIGKRLKSFEKSLQEDYEAKVAAATAPKGRRKKAEPAPESDEE
jgi:ATP-dependent Clp protease, protease subunit